MCAGGAVVVNGRPLSGRAGGLRPEPVAQSQPEALIPDADYDAEYSGDYDDGYCGNCGGEGFTYGCSWDWQCETYDEGEGTCLCTRRCEWCNPLTPAELAERKKLQDILATALAKDKVAEMRAVHAPEAPHSHGDTQ